MSGCYYCGKAVRRVCDYLSASGICGREVCTEHYVPEFEGHDEPDAYSLCTEHAKFQVKA